MGSYELHVLVVEEHDAASTEQEIPLPRLPVLAQMLPLRHVRCSQLRSAPLPIREEPGKQRGPKRHVQGLPQCLIRPTRAGR